MTGSAASASPVGGSTLPAMYRDSCRRYGDRTAVIDGDLRMSYAQLWGQASAVAKGLIARDLAPGSSVAIWAPNSWQWLVASTGVALAGCVLVPINTRFKRREAVHILASAQVEALFVSDRFAGIDYLGMLLDADVSPDTQQPIADLPHLASLVMLSGARSGPASSLDDLVQDGKDVADSAIDLRIDAATPDSVCDIMFTSGTTGLPKGVRSTHGTVLAAYRALSDVVGLTSSDRYLIVNPLFHAFGYRAGWLSCVLRGATVLPFARFEVEQLLQTVARELVTVLPGTPTVFQSILDSGHAGDYDLSSLRLSITGATMTSTLLVRRMHEELGFDSVLTGYGLTEHCGVATMCRPGDDFAARTTTSGRVIPGAELRIAAVDGEDADAGGEILVRGYVMAGYHEDARATSAVLGADGWLHTGDIGYLRPDGNLVVVGRLGDMFIVGGFNVYPAEVEALLTSHPAVKDAAVVGVPDRRMGEVGCAFIVPRDQHPPTEDELIAWCRDRLANFKVPRSVRYVSALPRTANGKVRSEELRTLAGRRAAD